MPQNSGSYRSTGFAAARAALARLRRLAALEARRDASNRARSNGHRLGHWHNERAPDEGWFARCTGCHLFAVVAYDEMGAGLLIDGSATRVPCAGRYATVPYWSKA